MALIDYAIVIIYLLGMVAVGLMLQKKASQGLDSYFLGSHELPWWALGASDCRVHRPQGQSTLHLRRAPCRPCADLWRVFF